MSENAVVPLRDERGRLLPGATLNPRGRAVKSEIERAMQEALDTHVSPEVFGRIVDDIVKNGSPKVKVSFLSVVMPYLWRGKPPTRHIRVNSKFEDMLALLGSNEPVTIDYETEAED